MPGHRDALTALDISCQQPGEDFNRELTEVLRHGHAITVTATTPATEVGQDADGTHPEVVIVVDASREPLGYIFPDWVRRQVAGRYGLSLHSLTETIRVLSAESLPSSHGHLHEWLNSTRPPVAWCPGRPPDQAHPTFEAPPCSKHR